MPSQPSPSGTNRRKRQAMISLTRPRAFKAGTELSPKPVSSMRSRPMTLALRSVRPSRSLIGRASLRRSSIAASVRKRSVLGIKAEGSSKFSKIVVLDEAADQPFALRRGEPEDAAALPGELLPHGKKQSRHEMQDIHPRLGKALEFFFPRRREGVGIDLLPEGVFEIGKRHAFAAQGPLQAQSLDDFACFTKKRGGGCGKRRTAGALVDQEPVATLSGIEDDLQGDRIQFLVLLDREEASLSAAVAMMSEGFASG